MDDVETSKGERDIQAMGHTRFVERKKEIMRGRSRTKKNMKEKSRLDDNQTKKKRQSRYDDEKPTKPNG